MSGVGQEPPPHHRRPDALGRSVATITTLTGAGAVVAVLVFAAVGGVRGLFAALVVAVAGGALGIHASHQRGDSSAFQRREAIRRRVDDDR